MKAGRSILFFCLLFVAILFFLMSPIFSISEIEISGNKRFSQSEILDIAGVKPGMNIFKTKYNNGLKKLLENTYIKYAEIQTALPDKISIEVVEREICGYVPYMGTYLYIDQDGYVLENRNATGEPRPIVAGLNFKEFSIGEQLDVDSKNSFDIVTTMSKLLLHYDYLNSVSEMNISDSENIHLYVDNIDISFGGIADADKKMRTLIEIVNAVPKGDRGVLHIEDVNETPYFTYTP